MANWRRSEHVQDAVAGACLLLFGAAAAYISSGYRGVSGAYPGVLGGVLAALGLVMVLRAVRRAREEVQDRPLTTSPMELIMTLAISAVYLALVPVIGFYTSSLLLLLVLPVALGLRRVAMVGISTALFIALVYGTFTIVLNRPLPREFFQL